MAAAPNESRKAGSYGVNTHLYPVLITGISDSGSPRPWGGRSPGSIPGIPNIVILMQDFGWVWFPP